MADAKAKANPFDEKKADAKPDDTAKQTKQEVKPLTTANWTPDIVAGGVSGFLGFTLAPLLALSLSFIDSTAFLVFALVLLFIIAAMIAWMSKHMELEGYRLFQQSYMLLMPVTTGFLTASLIIYALKGAAQTALGTINQVGSMGSSLGVNVPSAITTAQYAPILSPQAILQYTLLMGVVILVPFVIQGRKQLKFWWFLPLILPLGVCLLTYYLVGMAVTLN